MLLLTSTSDIIRVVTGSAADVDVHASYVDINGSTVTPGRTNTTPITTATTTTVVAAPAASTQRNVKALYIHNVSSTVSTTLTVQHFDGTTNIDLVNCTLLPDEHLNLNENGSWVHRTGTLAEYTYQPPADVGYNRSHACLPLRRASGCGCVCKALAHCYRRVRLRRQIRRCNRRHLWRSQDHHGFGRWRHGRSEGSRRCFGLLRNNWRWQHRRYCFVIMNWGEGLLSLPFIFRGLSWPFTTLTMYILTNQ